MKTGNIISIEGVSYKYELFRIIYMGQGKINLIGLTHPTLWRFDGGVKVSDQQNITDDELKELTELNWKHDVVAEKAYYNFVLPKLKAV